MAEMKNNVMKMEVKVISNEILKPSSPTPLQRQVYTLSSNDQTFPPIHSHMILFYPNTAPQRRPVDTTALKMSLCDTLTCYYIFAGRCADESTVLCQDQGVPFVVTHVNCDLSDVISSPNKMDLYTKLMPPQGEDYDESKSRKISELVLISFQINVFRCGGVAIGFEGFHKIMDMSSLANFFVYWAAVANGKPAMDLAKLEPNFEVAVKAFPPSTLVQRMVDVPPLRYMLCMSQSIQVVVRSFVFTDVAIEKLRVAAASEAVPRPTRFEAVGAFIWEHVLAAVCDAGQEVGTTGMTIFADRRTRTSPPLPKGAFGNISTYATARAENKGVGLRELAYKMHATLSKLKTSYEETQDDEKQEDFVNKPGFFKLSSWCKLGLSEADFGFGKPWIVPTNGKTYPVQRNFFYFTEDLSGTGIEVWLQLEEKEINILESNRKFLAFAVPN